MNATCRHGEHTWDVHAHHLPYSAVPLLADGLAAVSMGEVNGIADSIMVNGMAVGATTHQLGDIEGLVAATDAAGLDKRVMSPPPFTYRYWDDPEATLALHRLLNDATAELVEAHPDRFVGLATIPIQDPALAVAELRRAHDELGLIGVTIGTNVAGGNIADEVRRPVLAEASDRRFPVLVHPDFVPNPRWSTHYLINLIGMPVDTAIAMGTLIFSGCMAEYTDLRVCFLHGGGAAPYLFGRWDKGWKVRPESRFHIDSPPTLHLDRVFCDTLTHSPEALSYLVEVLGAANVVVGTDCPFDVEDPDPLGTLDAAPRLDDGERETIRSVSPVRWLTGTEAPEVL